MVFVISGRSKNYLWPILLGLPLSAAINILVKGPLALLVAGIFGLSPTFSTYQPGWFLLFLFLLAPVFEEAIKPLPLVLGRVGNLVVDSPSAITVGFALGVGFGLGEAGYLAYSVSQSPQYSGLPWYLFTGFLYERTLVCFIHGVMTAIFVYGIENNKLVWGYIAAILLHSMVNAGAVLLMLGAISEILTFFLLIASTILFAILFLWLRRRSSRATGSIPNEGEILKSD
jgi:hypothetical protein